MNPNLARLRPCPFEKLRPLVVGVTPAFIRVALIAGLGGLASYPTTPGRPALQRGRSSSPPTPHPKGVGRFVSRARDFHIELAEAT